MFLADFFLFQFFKIFHSVAQGADLQQRGCWSSLVVCHHPAEQTLRKMWRFVDRQSPFMPLTSSRSVFQHVGFQLARWSLRIFSSEIGHDASWNGIRASHAQDVCQQAAPRLGPIEFIWKWNWQHPHVRMHTRRDKPSNMLCVYEWGTTGMRASHDFGNHWVYIDHWVKSWTNCLYVRQPLHYGKYTVITIYIERQTVTQMYKVYVFMFSSVHTKIIVVKREKL